MPDRSLELVLERLDDRNTRFVFPSEIAASSMLVAALAASGRKALSSRRFIGWDAFKAEVFAGVAEGRPSTKAIRSIFARMLAADNAHSPFLTSIVPMQAASASLRFARSIAAALPSLRSVPEGPGSQLADWRELRSRYQAFMLDRGLYEASWLGRNAAGSNEKWLLLYPDLTEDWMDYQEAACSMPDGTLVLSGELGTEPVPAARFGTVVEELRAVLLTIREAVSKGADPAGIIISAAAPESVLPILEREAAVAGVPLDIREGRPLSEGSGGRLLSDAIAVSRSRMSFQSLRRLLLDASRPWKESDTARRLLAIGIAKHIVAPLPDGDDVWETSIGNDEAARRLYRGLRTACSRIAGAKGFRSLRSAFDAFRRAFLDESAWSPGQNDEIARCLLVLDELEEASLAAGLLPDTIPNAADAYLECLEDTRYLPVSESGGIAVYRFPVAAGSKPDMHFVVNLAQGAAVAAARPLSFLRSDVRDGLGAKDLDISSGLIRLLAHSGSRVFLSYSEDGPDGVRPPHPAIIASAPSTLGMGYEREAWLPSREADALSMEEAFPSQVSSAQAALQTIFRDSNDWALGIPEAPIAMAQSSAEAIKQAMNHDGRLRLSATSISEYRSCAFRRVFTSQLAVRPVDSGLSFIDNRLLGQIYHEAFGRLLEPLANAGLSIIAPSLASQTGHEGASLAAGETARPSDADIEKAMREAIEAVARERGPMAGLLVGSAEPILLWHFKRASASLLSVLDGQIPVMVDDKSLSARLETLNLELYGRPDLICVSAADESRSRATIVDYKKSRIPTKAELEPGEDGSASAIQIPAYAFLAESAGFKPEAAYYLSIEGAGPPNKGLLLVFGPGPKPVLSDDMMPLLKPALERAAAAAADIVNRGIVFVPAMRDRAKVCQLCDLRAVCRTHYMVR